jgi:CRISPR-associated exonuclease Cas4
MSISVGGVVSCHICPLRYYLERDRSMREPARYTMVKQLSYHLGGELDLHRIWREVQTVAPNIEEECHKTLRDWVGACRGEPWRPAAEFDVRVASSSLGVRGTIDRLFEDEPYFAIVRSTEAPEAGVWGTDRIRIACLAVCAKETLGIRTESGVVEYLPSGASRLCIPQPRDRRAALRAIAAAKRVETGIVPNKPRNAPCDRCDHREACQGGGRRLSDLL